MNSKLESVTSAELLRLLSSPVLGWAGRVGGVVRVAYQTTCARDHEYEGIDRDDVDDEIVETIGWHLQPSSPRRGRAGRLASSRRPLPRMKPP